MGRAKKCDVTLESSAVSSTHCGLELVDGHWRVVDLGSRNGIRVNNVFYHKKWLLPGDVLTIATTRYEILYEAEGFPPSSGGDEALPQQSLLERIGLSEKAVDDLPRGEDFDEDEQRQRWSLDETFPP